MATKKNVTKTEDQLPAYIKQGQARGNENVTSEDLQLPRLDVLQALSPQINKKKDDYIEGAEPGMIFNTLTGELYPSGVFFTPVSFVKRYLIWVNREKDSAGGLRGVFNSIDEAEDALEKMEDEDKLEIVPTAEHLVLLDDGTEVILSMSKSKMKVSRSFNSLVRITGGDRFAARYHLTAVDDEGPKGEFQNFSIKRASGNESAFPSEEVYMKAEKLYESIQAGAAQKSANYDSEMESEEAEY